MIKKNLSIILPVYHEDESLELMIKILTHSLDFEHEIIIVYDSLDDKSVPVAKKLEDNFDNVKSIHNKNKLAINGSIFAYSNLANIYSNLNLNNICYLLFYFFFYFFLLIF